jgi:glutathione peroxidase
LTGVAGRADDAAMGIHDHDVSSLAGEPVALREYSGTALLIVNVASRCGMTPQYEGLQRLHGTFAGRGFAVLGFPCNQFGGQEPGTAEQIREFCATTYGVTFPMFEKVEVNGPGRHPLFADLTRTADADGKAGAVRWNFEKFLVSPQGETVTRFRSGVRPEDPDLVQAVEKQLPA